MSDNLANSDNDSTDLADGVEELMTPVIEEAVAKAMGNFFANSEEKTAEAPERKDVIVNAPIHLKDPIIDADVSTRKGLYAFLGGWTKALYTKDRESLSHFYKGEQKEQISKDLSWGTTTAGGFTVPDPVLASDFFVQVIDRPRLQDVLRQVTADGVRGAIPNISANASASVVGENTTVTADSSLVFAESDYALDKAVVLSYVSQELLAGSSLDILGETQANQLVAIRNLIEDEITDGSNSSNTLDGTSWQSVAQSGAITYAGLKNLFHKLAVEYRGTASTFWVCHPNLWEDIMSLTDSQSVPLYNRGLALAPEQLTIFGSRVFLNPKATVVAGAGTNEGSIWYGDFNKAMAYVKHKDGIKVSVSEIGGDAYADVQVGIRTHTLFDSVALTNTTVDSSFGGAVVELTAVQDQ